MDVKKNYYTILGVSLTATAEDIKKAYRAMAMKHHPDHNPDSKLAEIKFEAIKEAYDVLSNLTLKRQYDASRRSLALSPMTYQRELRNVANYTNTNPSQGFEIVEDDEPIVEKKSLLKPFILLILSFVITLLIIILTKKWLGLSFFLLSLIVLWLLLGTVT